MNTRPDTTACEIAVEQRAITGYLNIQYDLLGDIEKKALSLQSNLCGPSKEPAAGSEPANGIMGRLECHERSLQYINRILSEVLDLVQ
jgi:hypothetical protein